jgi:hypothetical protein
VIATTPTNASADTDTIAITANVVLFISKHRKRGYCLRSSATKLQNERFSIGYI